MYFPIIWNNKVGKPTSAPPIPSIFEGRVPLCAPSQHRLAVYDLIAACASIAERLCNRKGLSRISVTRSFLLHKKNLAQRDKPFPMIAPRISSGFNPAAYHLCTAAYFCSQLWFPTVQDVLHADWQDVWHSPQPPFFTVFCKFFVFNVLICFIYVSSLFSMK